MPRAQDATCAICMDSLFHRRDDLDDVYPIVTPDCGHVFHELCLSNWFKAQAQQYIAQQREQYPDRRENSPSASEAPALCPTCRAECFADENTGLPALHRLFINFNEEGVNNGNSQIGSSPIRKNGRDQEREREVLNLARRARGLGEEIKELNERSDEDEVGGMLGRVQSLNDDLVSIKALNGIKTYVGGLVVALNTFRAHLRENPLIPTLEADIAGLTANNENLARQVLQMERIRIPAEIAKAVHEERIKGDRKVRQVKEDMELIKRELEREQVARKVARRERDERDKEVEKKMDELRGQIAGEVAERESLNEIIKERTKALKLLQAKTESRKEMKKEIEELQAENARLRDASLRSARRIISPSRLQRESSPLLADSSIEEIPIDLYLELSMKSKSKSKSTQDESLVIDLPSFRDDGLIPTSPANDGDNTTAHAGPSNRKHPTARTFSFDLDGEVGKSKKRKDTSTSKYFGGNDEGNDRDNVLIPATSPMTDLNDLSSPPKRSRTNPFTTTKQASDKRRILHSPTKSILGSSSKDREIIDISSPDRNQYGPLRTSKSSNVPVKTNPHNQSRLTNGGPGIKTGNGSGLGPQKSMVEYLGMADKNGRPAKGIVSGAKVKRKV